MNWFFDPCRRHRRNLALLASGALAGLEKDQARRHVEECAACQKYFEEVKVVVRAFVRDEAEMARVEPSPQTQFRWAAAIRAADKVESSRAGARRSSQVTLEAVHGWYRDVIWPYRRIWAPLGLVWLLILAGQFSLQEHPRMAVAKSAMVQQQMVASFRERQFILAELLADHLEQGEAERPKIFTPRPRTERVEILAV